MRVTIINQYYAPALAPTAHLCASLAEHRAQLGDEVTVIASRGGYGDVSIGAELSSPSGSSLAPSPGTPGEGGGGGLKSCTVDGRSESPPPYPSPGVPGEGTKGVTRHLTRGAHLHLLWSPRLGGASELRRLLDWATFYLLALWKVLTLPRQDCLIALTTPPYIAWAAVGHRLRHRRAKIILWNMDCYPHAAELAGILPRGGVVGRLLRAVNRALLRQVNHVICLDEPMVDRVFENCPPPGPDQVSIIPNWESLSMFPPGLAHPIERSDDRLRVLYLGNAGYGHDFGTLLDAAEMLRNESIDFPFVGGGSQIAYLKHECDKRGLANFSFRPYVDKAQTPALMREVDCALITLEEASLGIMSPSKLHASLAMGLAILYVGPAYSNVDAAITRFGCGCSLRVGDSLGVARFCQTLRSDKSMLSQLQLRARAAFAEAYCDRATLPAFDRVLDAVVGRARQSPSQFH